MSIGDENDCNYGDPENWGLIDSVMYPKARRNPAYRLLDGLLHGMIEQDPEVTLEKFLRYNAPKIIKQVRRDFEKASRRRERTQYY